MVENLKQILQSIDYQQEELDKTRKQIIKLLSELQSETDLQEETKNEEISFVVSQEDLERAKDIPVNAVIIEANINPIAKRAFHRVRLETLKDLYDARVNHQKIRGIGKQTEEEIDNALSNMDELISGICRRKTIMDSSKNIFLVTLMEEELAKEIERKRGVVTLKELYEDYTNNYYSYYCSKEKQIRNLLRKYI